MLFHTWPSYIVFARKQFMEYPSPCPCSNCPHLQISFEALGRNLQGILTENLCKTHEVPSVSIHLHPGRLMINAWNLQITHLERKMIFQTSMIMFHVDLQECNWVTLPHRLGHPRLKSGWFSFQIWVSCQQKLGQITIMNIYLSPEWRFSFGEESS